MRETDSPDVEDQQTRPLLAPLEEEIAHTNVFAVLHRIKRDVIVRPRIRDNLCRIERLCSVEKC